jgi:hypothetical protein
MGYPRHDEEIEMLERHAALDLISESAPSAVHLNGVAPPHGNTPARTAQRL